VPDQDLPTDQVNLFEITKTFTIDMESLNQGTNEVTTKYKCYTDGSKINGQVGSGWVIYDNTDNGPIHQGCRYLGQLATVFQAEITAITQACEDMSDLPISQITILCDSQAAILALENPIIKSVAVLNCLNLLNALGRAGWDITIKWIKAHVGHAGNELADDLAKQGAKNTQMGPEPFIPVPTAHTNRLIKMAMEKKWMTRWGSKTTSGFECRQTKQWFTHMDPEMTKKLLNLNRDTLGTLVQFFTGHNFLRKHQAHTDRGSTLCRLCGIENETTEHIVLRCDPLWWVRTDLLMTELPAKWNLNRIKKFIKTTKVAELLKPPQVG
jgi:ribonuclease HI